MAVRTILRMGDPRLLRVAEPVQAFGSAELQALIEDLSETMAVAQKLNEDSFTGGENSNFGMMFANKITVVCP